MRLPFRHTGKANTKYRQIAFKESRKSGEKSKRCLGLSMARVGLAGEMTRYCLLPCRHQHQWGGSALQSFMLTPTLLASNPKNTGRQNSCPRTKHTL